MNRIYCISDLHGHYSVLEELLKRIQFDSSDHLYILGDCNDRGHEAFDIYRFISQNASNVSLIKGNHELMMRDTLKSGTWDCPDGRLWSRNGGKKTMEEMKLYCKDEENLDIYKNWMISFLDKLPSFIELDVNGRHYVLSHSGINPDKSLYEQDEEECAWMREYFYLTKAIEDKIIIFGHTPVIGIHGRHDIWSDPVYKDKIGIDGGLGNHSDGQLNCLCLNDMSVTVIRKSEVEKI